MYHDRLYARIPHRLTADGKSRQGKKKNRPASLHGRRGDMRIGGERDASTRRDAHTHRPPPSKHTGAARPTTSRTVRTADPTEDLTRRGKPHETRGTEEKQPRTAMPTAPSRIPRRQASRRIRRSAPRERAEPRGRQPKQRTTRDERENPPRPSSRRTTSKTGREDEKRNDQRDDQRRMKPHWANTTDDDTRGQARRNDDEPRQPTTKRSHDDNARRRSAHDGP